MVLTPSMISWLSDFLYPTFERGNLFETAHHDEGNDHHGDENEEELVVSQGDISGIG